MRLSVLAVLLCACAAPKREQTTAPRTVAPPSVWPYSARARPLELDRPILVVDEASVTLDGVVVATTEAAPGRIEGLWTALKETRKRWIGAHPGTPFPGEVQLRAKSATDARVVRGVFRTSVMAGYPWIAVLVKTGDGTAEGALRVGTPVPPPIDLAPPSRTQLHVTRDALVFTAFDQQTIVREVRAPASIVELSSPTSPEPAPALLEPLRTVWSAGHFPWHLSIADGQTHGTLVAIVDATAVVAPDSYVTLD